MAYNPPVNLSPLNKDYSVFLPAISSFYTSYVSKQRVEPFVPSSRIPPGFDRGIEGMNFLNEEQGYFTYNCALFSAGHAQLDLAKSSVQESMIRSRDRGKTTIIGDSGGYQIGKGVLKFDWKDFKGAQANKIRSDILNWLEETADWSVMLDVPSWAADAIHSPKTGLKSYADCLNGTLYNNDYFIKNRKGKTKFLNVLQAGDWESGDIWYNAVKHYPTEGWAMGSKNMCDMEVALRRIIIMRDEKLLDDRDWMHFLGTGMLDWSCYLTAIQRQIRKTVNERFTTSLDCASPFISTAHGLVYTNAQHSPNRWSVIMDKAPDNKALAGSDIPFPFESEIGRRMVMGDICHYDTGVPKNISQLGKDRKGNPVKFDFKNPDHYDVIPKMNKIGKIGSTSWDSFSYALMMGHNTYCHIAAMQRANQLADIETVKYKPDWRTWKKVKPGDMSDNYSDWVPRNVLYFNRFVEELFQSETPMEMIEQAKPMLATMAGTRMRGGNALNLFGKLFDDGGGSGLGIDLEDTADPKYLELEARFNEEN